MAIIVGSVSVDVVPSVENFTKKAREKLVPQADRLGQDLGQHIGDNIRRRLEEEFRRLPNANIGLDTAKFDTSARGVKDTLVRIGHEKATALITADAKGFDLDAARVQLRMADIARLSSSAKITADDKNFNATAERVKFRMSQLNLDRAEPEIKPKIDSSQLDVLKGRLAELDKRAYSPDIKVADNDAKIRITGIRLRLAELAKVISRPELDLAGFLKAELEMAKLKRELDDFGHTRKTAQVDIRGVSQSEGGMRRLIDSILALAPAVVPLAGILTGLAGGLVGFASTAVAGLGAVGLVVKGQMSALSNDLFTLKIDNQKLSQAQAAVDNAKGPKDRAAAIKKLSAAQLQLNTDTKSFAPGERTLISLVGQLNAKWKQFIFSVVPAEVAPFKDFLRFLTPLFRALTPLINASLKAIDGLLIGARRALESPVWHRFFGFLTSSAGPAITALGKIIGNLVTGFVGLLIALQPLTKAVERGLVSITQKFADWGKNASTRSFQSFINYLKGIGPDVGKFLLAIGQAIVAIAKAAAPIGAIEVKALTAVLTGIANFASHHKTITEVAIAIFTLAKAMAALKLAALGSNILKTIGTIAALRGGGIKGLISLITTGKVVTSAAEGAGAAAAGAEGAGAVAASASSVLAVAGPIALAIAPMVALIVAKHLIPPVPHDPNPRVPNSALPNPGDNKTTTVDPRSGTQSLEASVKVRDFAKINHISIQQASIDIKNHVNPKPGDRTTSTLSDSRNIPVKVLISGDAVAAQKLLRVQKSVGGIPKNKDIRIGTPGVGTVQGALSNIIRYTHGLPPQKVIKVSSPGGNFTALTMLNISRAARGLPPTKKINISSPGVTGALANINTLGHQMGLLPKKKSVATSAPGAAATILQMINLDRRAHGLPPLKRIPTSAPGADKAVQQYIALARRADLIPPEKHINTSTPGAVKAYNQISDLLHGANILPKDKSIPTNVPGAQKSILSYIQLYEKAHHLPISKSIPTTAPHADKTIQQMIDLARKIGLVPAKHDTQINTPGAGAAKKAISDFQNQLATFPKHFQTNIDAVGNVRFGGTGVQGNKEGGPIPAFASGGVMNRPGYVRGPGGPRDDKILYAPRGVPIARVSNTEYVNKASVVSREGVSAFDALNRGQARIVPRFADGGSIFDIHEGVSHLSDIRGKILARVDKSIASAFKTLFSFFGSGGGGGSGQWIGVIRQALALLHQPLGLAGLFLKVIQGESGGNPRAINLSDSNARAGHPSVGLAQVIRGTFEAFAGPFRNLGPFLAGVSVNPLANIYAGLNYGIQTYGSVANIPGIRSELHGGGYRPYAKGGYAAPGVPIIVGDAGPEIFTPQTAGTIIPNGGGSVGTLPDAATIVHVYLGNREITDIVRTETERVSAGQARSLGAGRRRLR